MNYGFLKEAQVLDIFLELLSSKNEKLLIHGTAGICNICLDPESLNYIVEKGGFELVSALVVSSENSDVILNSLTTIYYLSKTLKDFLKLDLKTIQTIGNLAESDNLRIKKVATLIRRDVLRDESIS